MRTSTTTKSCARPAAAPTLLCAAPLQDFVDRLEAEMAALKKRFPESGHASMLGSIKDDLVRAIADAGNVALYVNIERLHALTTIPISTLRRQCNTYQTRIGASKRNGQWTIHWPTYDKIMAKDLSIGIEV